MFFSKADILIVRHRQDVMLRFWNTGSGVHQTSDGNTFLKSMSISAFLFFLSPQILGENCALTTQRRLRRARCSSLRGCGRAGVDWKADSYCFEGGLMPDHVPSRLLSAAKGGATPAWLHGRLKNKRKDLPALAPCRSSAQDLGHPRRGRNVIRYVIML